MPTSNGQITARDIRQQSIKTLHVVDEAITTPKIPDLAVTFPDKIDDPTWVEIQQFDAVAGVSLSTAEATCATVTVSVPAWVDQVSVFIVGESQLTNTSGAEVLLSTTVYVADVAVNGASHEVLNNQTQLMTVGGIFSQVGLAGSSFDVELRVVLSTGTNTSNNQDLFVLAVGTR